MKARCDFDVEEGVNSKKLATGDLARVKKSKSNRKPPSTQLSSTTKGMRVAEQEKSEVKIYLDKLQELVPFTPKNKTLSNLEVITSAIFYIRDLRETLGLPPCQNSIAAEDFDLELDQLEVISETQLPSSSQPSIPSSDAPTNPSVTIDPAVSSIDKSTLPSASSLLTSSTVAHSPITINASLSSSSLSPDNCHPNHIKRQPLCAIPSPNNTGGNGHRISQKS